MEATKVETKEKNNPHKSMPAGSIKVMTARIEVEGNAPASSTKACSLTPVFNKAENNEFLDKEAEIPGYSTEAPHTPEQVVDKPTIGTSETETDEHEADESEVDDGDKSKVDDMNVIYNPKPDCCYLPVWSMIMIIMIITVLILFTCFIFYEVNVSHMSFVSTDDGKVIAFPRGYYRMGDADIVYHRRLHFGEPLVACKALENLTNMHIYPRTYTLGNIESHTIESETPFALNSEIRGQNYDWRYLGAGKFVRRFSSVHGSYCDKIKLKGKGSETDNGNRNRNGKEAHKTSIADRKFASKVPSKVAPNKVNRHYIVHTNTDYDTYLPVLDQRGAKLYFPQGLVPGNHFFRLRTFTKGGYMSDQQYIHVKATNKPVAGIDLGAYSACMVVMNKKNLVEDELLDNDYSNGEDENEPEHNLQEGHEQEQWGQNQEQGQEGQGRWHDEKNEENEENEENAVIVPLDRNHVCIPTVFAFTDNGLHIGEEARVLMEHNKNSQNIVFDLKRIIGRTVDDPVVQDLKSKVQYDILKCPIKKYLKISTKLDRLVYGLDNKICVQVYLTEKQALAFSNQFETAFPIQMNDIKMMIESQQEQQQQKQQKQRHDKPNILLSSGMLSGLPFMFVAHRLVDEDSRAKGNATVSITMMPEILNAVMFMHMKKSAEKTLGSGIALRDVVLSVPASFTDAQQKSLLDSCLMSGLNPLRVKSEPSLAAITYSFSQLLKSESLSASSTSSSTSSEPWIPRAPASTHAPDNHASPGLPSEEKKTMTPKTPTKGKTSVFLQNVDNPATLLVVDAGASTTDVAVMTVTGEGVHKVEATSGAFVGGDDIDERFMEKLKEIMINKYGAVVGVGDLGRLRIKAEKMKCVLSRQESVRFDFVLQNSYKKTLHVIETITREIFESWIGDLMDKAMIPVKQALVDYYGHLGLGARLLTPAEANSTPYLCKTDAGVLPCALPSDFQTSSFQDLKVVMVGRTTKIPLFINATRALFPTGILIDTLSMENKENQQTQRSPIPDYAQTILSPDLAVATGAAITGYRIHDSSIKNKMLIDANRAFLLDVTRSMIGIKVAPKSENNYNDFSPIILHNKLYPIRVSHTYKTNTDFMLFATVSIFEGMSMNVSKNNFLGEFSIELPGVRTSNIDLVFEIDEEGTLSIAASSGVGKEEKTIRVYSNEGYIQNIFKTSSSYLVKELHKIIVRPSAEFSRKYGLDEAMLTTLD